MVPIVQASKSLFLCIHCLHGVEFANNPHVVTDTDLHVLLRAHNIPSHCIIQESSLFGLYVACYRLNCIMDSRLQKTGIYTSFLLDSSFFVLLPSMFLVYEHQYSHCNKTRDPGAGGIACLISDWRVNEL